jgi:hypothetical protein
VRVALVGNDFATELLIAAVTAGHTPVPIIEASAVAMCSGTPDRDALTSGPLPVFCAWPSPLGGAWVWTWDTEHGPSDEHEVTDPAAAMVEWLAGLPIDELDEAIPPD